MLHARSRDRRHQQRRPRAGTRRPPCTSSRRRGTRTATGAGSAHRCGVPSSNTRVQVRDQPLAQLEHVADVRFVWLAEGPRLLGMGVPRPSGCGRTAERCRTPSSVPAARRWRRRRSRRRRRPPRRSPTSPRFCSCGMLIHRCSHQDELSPVQCSAWRCRPAKPDARDHERPALRPQPTQPFARGPRHELAVQVVHLRRAARAFAVAVMRDVVWQRLRRRHEHRGLVHVAPDAGDAARRAATRAAGRPTTSACAGR